MADAIYVATETFHTELLDGTPVLVHRDITHVLEGSELQKRFPENFAPALDRVDRGVEAATAEPVVKRRVKKPSED